MVGEGVDDAPVAGGFAIPAARLSVGLKLPDVGELAADGVRELGPGDRVESGH